MRSAAEPHFVKTHRPRNFAGVMFDQLETWATAMRDGRHLTPVA